MKTGYEKELNRVTLHIDIPHVYEENYQMRMLRENRIPGILEISGCGIEGKTRYSYGVTGFVTMKKRFETVTIKKEDMITFVNHLLDAVNALQRYMLNPDGLLLYPEFLFYGEMSWHFCYLPGRKKSLCRAFHVITEYFVRKLDYQDTEGIMLAYELHKATLQENYSLEKIMDEYKIHEEKRREDMTEGNIETGNKGTGKIENGESYEALIDEDLSRENVFSLEDEYETTPDVETLREMGGRWNPLKKTADKLKKGRWGSWKDLIMETDGQETDEPL